MADELKNRLLDEAIELKNFISREEVLLPNQTGYGCPGGLGLGCVGAFC